MPTPRRLFAFAAGLALASAVAVPLLAQADWLGSGKPVTEARTLAEFQAIELAGSIDLRVRQGQQQVQVTADDNLIALLETVVERGPGGGTLKVRWKPGQGVVARDKTRVVVTMPRLVALSSAGSGDMAVEPLATPSLDLALAGSGDASLDGLVADDLSVTLAGSGDVRGSGKVGRLRLSLAGSGDARLASLQAADVKVNVAGSGDAAVHADRTLAVAIAGSGDVRYSGAPTVTTSVVGSGSVRRR